MTAPHESPSAWKRFLDRFNAFMEVLEMDIHDYQDLRIANLEKRLAKLEARSSAPQTASSQDI